MQKMAWSLAALAGCVLAAGRCGAAQPLRAALYGEASRFGWEERLPAGKRVKEDGRLYGVGGQLDVATETVTLKGRLGLFGGEVDYDGFIQLPDGRAVPATSATDYAGLSMEGEVALPLTRGGRMAVAPYGGLGLKAWERRLGAGESDFGYTEYWYTLYGLLGAAVSAPLGGEGSTGFARAGLLVPLDNRVRFELDSRLGDIELAPGRKIGWTVEGGVAIGRFRGTLFAEQLRFGKSDLDTQTEVFYQPESEALTAGVRLGARL